MIKRKKKGIINVAPATAACIFILLSVFVVCIFNLKPIIIYFHLSQECRQTLLKMEVDGGITTDSREQIKKDLSGEGLNVDNLVITPENDITDDTKIDYGQEVPLELKYTYYYKSFSLIGFSGLKQEQASQVIKVKLSTTSKKAK